MRMTGLSGREAEDREWTGLHEAQVARAHGAGWFADPYGSNSELRWYDGTKWTDQVRAASNDLSRAVPSLQARPARRASVSYEEPKTPAEPPQPAEFPVRLNDTIGERLQLLASGPRGSLDHELVSRQGRVACVRLFARRGLATVRCAEGSWSLTKHRRIGSELLIEGADGANVGRYSAARRWPAGGSIILSSGAEVELVRSMSGSWKLRRATDHQTIASIRVASRLADPMGAVVIRSLPDGAVEQPLTILMGCALISLNRCLPARAGGS